MAEDTRQPHYLEKAARSSRRGEAAAWIITWLTLLVLAWAPLPRASNQEWGAALLAALIAALLLAALPLVGSGESRRGSPPFEDERPIPLGVLISGLLIALVAVYSWLQIDVRTPAEWHHPIWSMLEESGIAAESRISLSAVASEDALVRLLAPVAMFALCFALARSQRRARHLLHGFVVIATAIAAGGLIGKIIGIEFLTSRAYADSVTSTFINRNHFATYVNLGVLVTLALMIEPLFQNRGGEGGSLLIRLARGISVIFEQRRFLAIALVILVLASVSSLSRGGLLSAVVAVSFLLFVGLISTRTDRRLVVLVLAGSLVVLGLIVWLAGEPLLARFEDLQSEEDIASGGRLSGWQVTLEAIAERPWLGYGHGAYQEMFLLRRDERFGGVFDHAHNDYLEILAELGLIAGAALLLALALLFATCLRGALSRRRGKLYPLTGAAACVLIAVHALVDFSMAIPAVAVSFAALLGIACAQARSRASRARHSHEHPHEHPENAAAT